MALRVCAGCSTRYAEGLPRCPHCSSAERVEERVGSVLPFLDVACPTEACAAAGTLRRVYLRLAAPGVVEQPVMGCVACGAIMAAAGGWRTPPQKKETEDMPKITRVGGPSNADAEREHPGTGVPTEPVEMPADGTEYKYELAGSVSGEAPLPADEAEEQVKKPKRRTSKTQAADDADTSLVITAEAQVTRPDGTVS